MKIVSDINLHVHEHGIEYLLTCKRNLIKNRVKQFSIVC